MARGKQTRDLRMRERLVQEAARIMAVEGIRDFSQAKRKAALHLGAPGTTNLPQNREIQAALEDYQRLFGGERQQLALRTLREAALEAMQFFAPFSPRLVGGVLDGTAGPESAVDLHCFADTPEDVVLFSWTRVCRLIPRSAACDLMMSTTSSRCIGLWPAKYRSI